MYRALNKFIRSKIKFWFKIGLLILTDFGFIKLILTNSINKGDSSRYVKKIRALLRLNPSWKKGHKLYVKLAESSPEIYKPRDLEKLIEVSTKAILMIEK